VQVVELKLPRPLLEKPTVPLGVPAVPGAVSVTVAVHCCWFDLIGVQLTFVEVVRLVTVTVVVPLLAAYVESPL
jgi:hypothetical protein